MQNNLTQGQNLYVVGDGCVRVCAYANDSVGWMCSQKRERTKSAALWEVFKRLKRSRKGEAAIKSRMVCVNCENNFKKVNAYWLQNV